MSELDTLGRLACSTFAVYKIKSRPLSKGESFIHSNRIWREGIICEEYEGSVGVDATKAMVLAILRHFFVRFEPIYVRILSSLWNAVVGSFFVGFSISCRHWDSPVSINLLHTLYAK